MAVEIISFSPVSFSRVAHFMAVDGNRELNIRREKSDNAQTSLRPLVVWNWPQMSPVGPEMVSPRTLRGQHGKKNAKCQHCQFILFNPCHQTSRWVFTQSGGGNCSKWVWSSLVLLDKGQELVDVVRGAHHEGHPLMEPLGLDVQDPLRAGGGDAPRLLHDEGYGVALVQQPQL